MPVDILLDGAEERSFLLCLDVDAGVVVLATYLFVLLFDQELV